MAGHFHSDAMHVVERFTPIDKDTIEQRSDVRRSEGFYLSVQNEISTEEGRQSSGSLSNRTVSAASAIRRILSAAFATLKEHYYTK